MFGKRKVLLASFMFIRRTPQRREQFCSMEVSQFDLDNETMKDLMMICDNDMRWNSAYNMIERTLHLFDCINAFCAIKQRTTKRSRDGLSMDDDDGSIRHDSLTPAGWDTLKELYNLTKLFRDFTACIVGRATTGSCGAQWEVLLAIKLVVTEYKRFATQYTALAIHNYYGEVEEGNSDMKTNFILLFINNALVIPTRNS